MTPVDPLRPTLEAAASQLGLDLLSGQVDALLTYLRLLQRWNGTYNLTSIRDPAQMLTQHLADCLSVIRPLLRQGPSGACRMLDVGSGGGLPGAVVAIVCPSIDVTCVDAVGKKAAFVQQAAGELQLPNLHARHARIEALDAPPFSVIASRAFGSLADFANLTRRHLSPLGIWMAMKGKRPNDELALLPIDIDVFHVEQLVVPGLNAERCLIWMRSKVR